MKIVHAYKIYRPDVNGGIPAVMAMLCLYRAAGSINEIVVARRFGWFRKYLFDNAPVTATTSFGTLFSTPLAPTFPSYLIGRAKTADILVHHAPFPLTDLAVAIGLPKSVSLIVYWHAEIVGRSFLKWLVSPLLRRTLRRANKIIVSDEFVAQNSPLLSIHREKTSVIPYGVDTQYWAALTPAEQDAVDELRAKYPRLIVAVGRLVPYKGYDVLLRAICKVDAEVVIVGDGPLRAKLERQAVRLGVSNRVTIRRDLDRDKVKTHLHAARLLVMPSINEAEAFGIVQIEAMAAGRPVVNTSLSTAVPHIARHGIEGLTVPPNNSDALADALRHLLDYPALAEQMGAAARSRAKGEYDESRFLERINAVYQDVRSHVEAASSV